MAKIQQPAINLFLVISGLLLAITSQHPAVAFAARNPRPSSSTRATTMRKNSSSSSSNNNNNGNQAVQDENKSFEVQTWNPLRLAVLRLGLTEPAMTSPLNYGKKEGTFQCAYCGQTLFDSDAKYDSGSGWPSFWRSIDEGSIDYKREFDGRLECRCGRCKSHLGHVFLDGPRPSQVDSDLLEKSPASDPRGRQENGYLPRFCVNGASLRYNERQK